MTKKKFLTVSVYALAVALLFSLGLWQIQRGHSKAQIMTRLETDQPAYQPLREMPNDFKQLIYLPAQLAGQWQAERSFLLANRIHRGQAGFEVLSPFQLNSGETLLVNRGWIPKDQAANFATPQDNTPPTGLLYAPQKGFTIGSALTPEDAGWPRETLYLDIAALETALKTPLSNLVLVLAADNANSFTRIWQPVVVSPMRHYAYAAQWFGLMIALLYLGFRWRAHFLDEDK